VPAVFTLGQMKLYGLLLIGGAVADYVAFNNLLT
jgi:hypothetical protein